MFCVKCGAQLSNETKFCHKCGSANVDSSSGEEKGFQTRDDILGQSGQQIKTLSAIDHYKNAWKKSVDFSGRSQRAEYWYFLLFNLLIAFCLGLLEGLLGIAPDIEESVLATIFQFIVLIPSIAVGVRRMHDIGNSGWWLLLPVVNFFMLITDGQAGLNKYGPDPKGRPTIGK